MNIVLVDDEILALNALKTAVAKACPKAVLFCFDDADEVIEFAKKNSFDIAFLDIEICETSGLSLAKRLKEYNPELNIIFVTGYSEYAVDSYSIAASGYILKPVSSQAVESALSMLRYKIPESKARVKISCFGNFEIFVDGVPLHFKRAKAKEALAYLVDRRGSAVKTAEMTRVLFDTEDYNRSAQMQIQVVLYELKRTLEEAEVSDILQKRYNSISINAQNVECDYYDFLDMKAYAVKLYRGEYMSNYKWAKLSLNEV